jgi:Zn-dependent protease
MKKYILIRFLRIYSAPVYIHWSALLVILGLLALSIKSPVLGLISICSYFGVILLHEAGHAYLANRLGYKVHAIYLGFIHGQCDYEIPYQRISKHECIISWGGVLSQLAVAIPLILLAQLFNINNVYGFGPIVMFLGYISAMIAIVNLAPSHPLDGASAWKLIPMLVRERRNKNAKKSKKSKFKVVK